MITSKVTHRLLFLFGIMEIISGIKRIIYGPNNAAIRAAAFNPIFAPKQHRFKVNIHAPMEDF